MDLKESIEQYSEKNGYRITDYKDIRCSCGENHFYLYSDDDEGGAYVMCVACDKEQDIEASQKYIVDEVSNVCNCDNEHLLVGVGKAFFEGSNDPRWVYVGAKCDKCGLAGVYVDWKES